MCRHHRRLRPELHPALALLLGRLDHRLDQGRPEPTRCRVDASKCNTSQYSPCRNRLRVTRNDYSDWRCVLGENERAVDLFAELLELVEFVVLALIVVLYERPIRLDTCRDQPFARAGLLDPFERLRICNEVPADRPW